MLKYFYTWYLLVAVLILNTIGCMGQSMVSIDANHTFQRMEGFGASDAWRMQYVGANWPLEKREQIADLLFSMEEDDKGNPKGIGLSIWRFYIGSGSKEQGDSSGIKSEWRRTECFLNADGTYDWSRQRGQKWFLQAAKTRGVDKFLAFSIAAPTFMAINEKGFSIKEDPRINVKPGMLDDYAGFLIDVVAYFDEKEDIHFDYLSPFNEPQWDWATNRQEGTAATNEDIYLFTRYLSDELAKRNLTTELVLGEAGDIQYLNSANGSEIYGNQIETFFDPKSPLYLKDLPQVKPVITGHSYFTTWPVNKLIKTREALKAKLDEYNDLGYWQTEFCILENSPETGGGGKRDLGMSTALYVARVIHADLTITNAASWQWWTALTTFDFKDGLIYLDTGDDDDLFNRDRMKTDGKIRDSKLLWAFGNYSRFIRPGMIRVKASANDDRALQVSAYKGADGKLVTVVINHENSDQKIELEGALKASAMYITDETRNLKREKVKGNEVKVPARSVVTITGKLQ